MRRDPATTEELAYLLSCCGLLGNGVFYIYSPRRDRGYYESFRYPQSRRKRDTELRDRARRLLLHWWLAYHQGRRPPEAPPEPEQMRLFGCGECDAPGAEIGTCPFYQEVHNQQVVCQCCDACREKCTRET